jgi:hypothetical protein
MFDGNDLQIQDSNGQFVSSPNQMPNLAIPNYSGPQTNTWSGLIDINQDSQVDMILGKWDNQWSSSKYSQAYLGDNNGGFSGSAAINLPHSPVDQEIVLDIKPIDLNGDNLPDLALSVTNGGDANTFYHTAYVQLLVNDGGGNFHDETSIRFAQSSTTTQNFDWIKSITVTDLNHDGFSDLVLDNNSTFGKVVMNDGKGHFNQVQKFEKTSNNAAVDVNNDGMSDLVVSGPIFGNIDGFDIYLNTMANGHIYKANFGGDTLLGSNQADHFISGDGIDKFTGNGGVDVVQMHGNKSNYNITTANGVTTIKDNTKADGVDTLVDIDRIQFSDKTLAFDLDGNAGQAYRLYQAAFDRMPDQGGLGYWINEMDQSMGLSQVATGFINSAEFKSLYGNNPSDSEFVTLLYDNVLHRAPDAGGYAYWMNELAHGVTREQALIGFSESTENKVALMAFDMDGNMGKDYRLYQAAFDRKPDVSGLDYWYHQMNSGVTLQQVASGFINSAEFKALYGSNPSNAEFVTLLYDNVLHRAPDTGGFNFWMNELDHGTSKEQVLIGFSESIENQLSLVGIVQSGIDFA